MIARGATALTLSLTLLIIVLTPAAAQLRLTPVIGDGMVMQRRATVPVWGWTDRGDTVVVTFDHQTYTAVPDTRGRWIVKLPPRPAGGPYEMTVVGKHERIQVRDILVGDVWLCAGQSNMRMEVKQARNAAQEIAAARDPQIRHFKVRQLYNNGGGIPDGTPTFEPAAELAGGAWAVADSAHVGDFTAVGYFFARELRKSVDVPIGLINISVGGSAIEQWMSHEALRLDSADVARLITLTPNKDERVRAATVLYNTMVHPLLPYPIKGIVWYQGESNSGSRINASYRRMFPDVTKSPNIRYRELFPDLIMDWRRAWKSRDLPLLFVQLPNIGLPDTVPVLNPGIGWVMLRESQSTALRLPKTAQVVTIDLGLAPGEKGDDLHPTNKQDVGARLALAARKVAYGDKIEYSGPQYRRHTIREGRVLVEFDHIGRGLVVGRQKGELGGFAIAGANRQFVWANAKIDEDRVVVWSERVPQPVAVRYAWADNPDRANLYNQAGLPAVPFRIDEWPYESRDE